MATIKSATTASNVIPQPESSSTPLPNNAENVPPEPNTTPPPKPAIVNAIPQEASTQPPSNVNAREEKFGSTMIANAQKTSLYGTERSALPVLQEPTSSQKIGNVTTVQKVSL